MSLQSTIDERVLIQVEKQLPMVKRISSLLLLLCFSIVSIQAQSALETILPARDTVFAPKLTGKFYYDNKQVIGEPFVQLDWTRAHVILEDADTIENKLLKYNGLIDNFVWLNTWNYALAELDRKSIKEVWFEEMPVVVFRKMYPNDLSDSVKNFFAELHFDGRYKLYTRHRMIHGWPVYKMIDNIRRKYDVLLYKPLYYIELPSGKQLVLDKISLRDLYKKAPGLKPQIQAIIRKYHLKLRNIVELNQLVQRLSEEQ